MVRRVFGAFAAVQTFFWLARGDRFEVLLWFTGETWLYVLLLWLKDLALAAAAGWVASRLLAFVTDAAAREEREPAPPLRPAAEAACVIPALAAGVALRWVFSSWNPPGLWVDVVYAARPLFGGGTPPLWGASPFGRNPASHEVVSNLYVAFVRGVFALFGSGETGLFAVSALPGSLAVAGFWWAAREAFGARTAAAAALIGALLGWPLLLSRWTWTAALLVALVLLAAAAALRALRTGSSSLAGFSGACIGLSLHTHASAGAVAAAFALFAPVAWGRVGGRRQVLAAAGAVVLAFAPLAWGFVAGPARFGGHLRDIHFASRSQVVDVPHAPGVLRYPVLLAANTLEYTGVLLWTRDAYVRHTAGRALVSLPFGALALLGLGLAAARRRSADVLLLLVAGGSLLAGYPRETPAGILASPPPGPFWVLASRRGLAELAAGGLRCARGIAPAGGDVLLARVRQPG